MYLRTSILFFLIARIIEQNSGAVMNFLDQDFFGKEADRIDWSKHPCRRKCMDGEPPRVCKYVFVVEKFSSMSKACYDCPFNVSDCFRPHCIPTDGIEKPIYVVNRQLPGPLIEVCQNDYILVETRNKMLSDSFTIHWHGFKQFGTPYFDGVPFVTQCPVLPGNTFQYFFNATTTGTFFWHSHIGNQRADGFFGAMVVNDVHSEDIFVDHYDYDIHRVIVNEWKHRPGDVDENHDNYEALNAATETILINGRGNYVNFIADDGELFQTPLTFFNVQPDKKYRFRLINAGSDSCHIQCSIDDHPMLVIALDSKYIKPVEVDMITTLPGERYDFIINATQPSGNYWLRCRGFGRCSNSKSHQVAIIHYTDVELKYPKAPVGYEYPVTTNVTRELNPFNASIDSNPNYNINIPSLTAMEEDDLCSNAEVDQQVFIVFDAYGIDNYDFHRKNLYGINQVSPYHRVRNVQFNHISLKLPEFPLVSQWQLIQPDMLCNSSYIPETVNCTVEQCSCTHVINAPLNYVIEIVLITEGLVWIEHPSHLHGHFFRVVGMEKVNGKMSLDRFKQMDREGKIVRNLHKAPFKDTMKTPGNGYTIIRFLANNPGYWYFHCHFEPHNNQGMALVFKVGEHEDFPPVPRNFPKCGPFAPEDLTMTRNPSKYFPTYSAKYLAESSLATLLDDFDEDESDYDDYY